MTLDGETLAVVSLSMNQLKTTSAARHNVIPIDPDRCSVAQLFTRLRKQIAKGMREIFFARTWRDELANAARLPVGIAAAIN